MSWKQDYWHGEKPFVGYAKQKDHIYTKKELEKIYGEKGTDQAGTCPKCHSDLTLYGSFYHCLDCGYWAGIDALGVM